MPEIETTLYFEQWLSYPITMIKMIGNLLVLPALGDTAFVPSPGYGYNLYGRSSIYHFTNFDDFPIHVVKLIQKNVTNGINEAPIKCIQRCFWCSRNIYYNIYYFPIGFRIKSCHVQFSKCADIHVSEHLCLFTIPARYSKAYLWATKNGGRETQWVLQMTIIGKLRKYFEWMSASDFSFDICGHRWVDSFCCVCCV